MGKRRSFQKLYGILFSVFLFHISISVLYPHMTGSITDTMSKCKWTPKVPLFCLSFIQFTILTIVFTYHDLTCFLTWEYGSDSQVVHYNTITLLVVSPDVTLHRLNLCWSRYLKSPVQTHPTGHSLPHQRPLWQVLVDPGPEETEKPKQKESHNRKHEPK